MKLHQIKKTPGSTHNVKRVGRGSSSGTGKTSGRGQKGQNSRSGGGTRPGFEGGQMPLFRRIPKFGFTPLKRKVFQIINLQDLNSLKISEINPKTLFEQKLIKNPKQYIKILGNGEIDRAINCQVHKISASAKAKIIAKKGQITLLPMENSKI